MSKKTLLTLVALVALAAALFYSMWGGRSPLHHVAGKLPGEANGMLVIKAPKESLTELINALEGEKSLSDFLDDFREEAKEELDFDPLDLEALEENTGIDLSKDLFFAVHNLDSEGEVDFIGGIGVSDILKLKGFIEELSKDKGEELEIEIEETEGVQYATSEVHGEKEGVAYDGSHLYIGGHSGWANERNSMDVLEDFMSDRDKATLASSPVYTEAASKVGSFPISGFINLAELFDAMPERKLKQAPDFVTDLEAFAFGISTHEADLALSFADGAEALELMEAGESVTSMFKRMNKPIYAASASLEDPYAALELLVEDLLPKYEQEDFLEGKRFLLNMLELEEEEAQEILKGAAIGVALFDFSVKGYQPDVEFIAFVHLNDEDQKLEDELRKLMRQQIKPEKEEVEDYELYTFEEGGLSFSFTVIDDYFVIGDTDSVEDLAKGEVKDSWSPSVGEGLASLYINSLKVYEVWAQIVAMNEPQAGKLLEAVEMEDHYEQYETTATIALDGRTLRGTIRADIKTTGKYETDVHFLVDLLGDLAKAESMMPNLMRELQYMF